MFKLEAEYIESFDPVCESHPIKKPTSSRGEAIFFFLSSMQKGELGMRKREKKPIAKASLTDNERFILWKGMILC